MSNINVRYDENSVHTSAKKEFAPPPNICTASTLSWSYMRRYLASEPPYSAPSTKCMLLHCNNIYNNVIMKSDSKYMIGKMKCENM